MKAKELAERLNGREYLREITPEEVRKAKENGLVVVFGYGDDNVELDGAIRAEVGAWEGATFYLTKEGILEHCEYVDCIDDCALLKEKAKSSAEIRAVWDPPEGGSWAFYTDIPHESFEVLDDGELFCTGIVFSVESLPPGKPIVAIGEKFKGMDEYQIMAQRTSRNHEHDQIANGVMGLNGESGECIDIVKKHLFQGHPLNREQLIIELGDVLWYVAETAAGLNVSMSEIARINIEKLLDRYPDGFTTDKSVNRRN